MEISYSSRHWLSPNKYEIDVPAALYWRTYTIQKAKRAFSGWKVVLSVENTTDKAVYSRLDSLDKYDTTEFN